MSKTSKPKKENPTKNTRKKVKKESEPASHTDLDAQEQFEHDCLAKASKISDVNIETDFPFPQHEVKEILILNHQEQDLPLGLTLAVLRRLKKTKAGARSQFTLYDISNKQELYSFNYDRRLTYCDMHYLPKLKILLHQDQNTIVYYSIDFKRFRIVPRGYTVVGSEVISFTPTNNSLFLCHTADFQTVCFDVKTRKILFKITNLDDQRGTYPFHVFLQNKNAFASINCPEGTIKMFDFISRKLLGRTSFEDESVSAFCYIPERYEIIVGLYRLFEHSRMLLLDANTLEVKKSTMIKERCINQIEVGNKMESLFVWFTTGKLKLCTLYSFETVYQYDLQMRNVIRAEHLDRDGKFLVLGERLRAVNID